jgi:hypothetical protein
MLHKYNGLEKEGGWAEGLYTTVQHFFNGTHCSTSIKGVSEMKKNNFFFEQKTPTWCSGVDKGPRIKDLSRYSRVKNEWCIVVYSGVVKSTHRSKILRKSRTGHFYEKKKFHSRNTPYSV